MVEKEMFANRLKSALEYRNKKPIDLTHGAGLNKSLVSQYLNSKFEAKNDKIDIIAKYLNVSQLYLMGLQEEIGFYNYGNYEQGSIFSKGYVSLRVVPIGASCGNGVNNNDYPLKKEMFPEELINGNNYNDYFLSYAVGASMELVGIHDGDLLLFHEQPTLYDGEIGLFTYNDQEFIKRFKKINDIVMLISETNDKSHEPIIVSEKDKFIIRAKLSKVIKDFEQV